jgi:hypothetical protein
MDHVDADIGYGRKWYHAQDAVPRIGYFLKADANGVQQVYQLPMDGQSEARQITHAVSDVLTFGAAYDGLSVAYISAGQLWLQPIHTEEAEALAPVTATQFFHSPVFSQDGQYVAYSDNGVWLLDLTMRQTRQVLTDVALDATESNIPDLRVYHPEQFVIGVDGKVSQLIVKVGVWEWNTVGVYDLVTGDFQMLEGQIHTDLLPLSNGKVLVYGNSGLAGSPALHIADSLKDINHYSELLQFGSVTSSTLFANQALEIQPGIVRIFGEAIPAFPDEVKLFYLDYDLTSNTVGQLHMIHLQNSSGGSVVTAKPSADGSILPVYQNTLYTDAGTPYGQFSLINLAKNDEAKVFDGTISLFGWQP